MLKRGEDKQSNIVLCILQIIQSEGSYSFLLCGMIIGCMGSVFFLGLLFLHRMHRKYLTGTRTTSAISQLNILYIEEKLHHLSVTHLFTF